MEFRDQPGEPFQQPLPASAAHRRRRPVLPLNQPVTSAVQPPNPSHQLLEIVG